MNTLNIKTLAALAATLIAASAHAGTTPEKKCGAGSCSKKAAAHKASDAACSKKAGEGKASDAACSKKDKDASCSKKDASCSKK